MALDAMHWLTGGDVNAVCWTKRSRPAVGDGLVYQSRVHLILTRPPDLYLS